MMTPIASVSMIPVTIAKPLWLATHGRPPTFMPKTPVRKERGRKMIVTMVKT